MNTINHGNWLAYTPAPAQIIKDAPPNTMYCRRGSDQIDWYAFSQALPPSSTVKCVAHDDGTGIYIVGPATTDVTRLFPAGGILFEITDYVGADPQADIGGMVYNPVDGTLSPPPPVVNPLPRSLIVDRLHLASKLDAFVAHLNANTYERERWYADQHFMPTDAILIASLNAIGANVTAILAPA